MDPKIRVSIIVFFLIFVELYPASVNGLRISVDPIKPPSEVTFRMKGRQLMKIDFVDYRDSDYNHKNDQGKGKPHV